MIVHGECTRRRCISCANVCFNGWKIGADTTSCEWYSPREMSRHAWKRASTFGVLSMSYIRWKLSGGILLFCRWADWLRSRTCRRKAPAEPPHAVDSRSCHQLWMPVAVEGCPANDRRPPRHFKFSHYQRSITVIRNRIDGRTPISHHCRLSPPVGSDSNRPSPAIVEVWLRCLVKSMRVEIDGIGRWT